MFLDQSQAVPEITLDRMETEVRLRAVSDVKTSETESPGRTRRAASFQETSMPRNKSVDAPGSKSVDMQPSPAGPVQTVNMLEPLAEALTSNPSMIAPSTTTSSRSARAAFALNQLQQALQVANEATSGFKCAQCNGVIASVGDLVRGFDKTWHKEHYACKSCSKSLVGDEKAVLRKDDLYCAEHAATIPQTFGTCAACDDDISTAYVDAMDRRWHQECFVCTACGTDLKNNYVPYEGMPYCRPDYLKRAGLNCGVCGENIETGNYFTRIIKSDT
jgi:transcription elongation factor Elf1